MEDSMTVDFAVKRMLSAQEVLARDRVGDPGVTDWDVAKARVSMEYNRRKLGYLLKD